MILKTAAVGFSLLALPLAAFAQSNTMPVRPLQAPPVPVVSEVLQTRPLEQVLQTRPLNLEQLRQAKEEALQNIEAQRERLKSANVLERPMVLADIMQTRREMVQALNERQQAVAEMLREKRAASSTEVQQRRAEVLERYLMRFGEVLEGRIQRLIAVADRLDERMLRWEEERGVDLSAAKALLEEAYALLDEAMEKAEEFSNATLEATDDATAQTAAAELKALRAEVQEAIRLAHQKLSEAIAAVREGFVKEPVLPPGAPDPFPTSTEVTN